MVFLLQSKSSKLHPSAKWLVFLASLTKLWERDVQARISWTLTVQLFNRFLRITSLTHCKPSIYFRALEFWLLTILSNFIVDFWGEVFLSSSLCHNGGLNTENLCWNSKSENRHIFTLINLYLGQVLGHPKYCLDRAEELR